MTPILNLKLSQTFRRTPNRHIKKKRKASNNLASPICVSLQAMPEVQTGELARRKGGLIRVPAAAKLSRRPERWVGNGGKSLTKLLLNVTVQGSLGPVQVVMSPENTVGELTKAALEAYMRERRRPLQVHKDPGCFQLHYSQFSLESIKPGEKLINLGSRNFFLCRNPACSDNRFCSVEQMKKTVKNSFPLIRLMDFLL